MSEATFEGTTVEAALAQAATEMGTDTDRLEYEVVEEKQDFWGLGDGKVVIRAWIGGEDRDADRQTAATDDAGAGGDGAAGDSDALELAEIPSTGGDDDALSAADERDRDDVRSAADTRGADRDRGRGGFWSEEAPAEPEAERATEAESSLPAGEEDVAEGWSEEPEVATEADTGVAAAPAPPAAAPPEAKDNQPRERDDRAAAGEPEDADPAAMSALLEQIFHDMAFDCTVSIEPQEGGFLASVSGADKDLLLEGNGRCLSALELILNNSFRHKLPQGQKIRVDAGDFRSRREEELADLAYQVAHSAKEAGRTQETQPLNPYERRLVHLALADDPSVTTRSRGSGFLKNVQVIPRRGGGDARRRRR